MIFSIVYFEQLELIWNIHEVRNAMVAFEGADCELFRKLVLQAMNAGGCTLINVSRRNLIVKRKASSAAMKIDSTNEKRNI